jgi:hypothetical protein
MRSMGDFTYITSTRILKPTADRSYFYLVYGTRHVKGLREFRGVEKQAIEEQERVRLSAKQTNRVERTGQPELFLAVTGQTSSFDEDRASQLAAAQSRLRAMIHGKKRIKYEDVLGPILEIPLVWESDIQQIIGDMRATREITIENLKPRERTIKPGHVIASKAK